MRIRVIKDEYYPFYYEVDDTAIGGKTIDIPEQMYNEWRLTVDRFEELNTQIDEIIDAGRS